MITHSEREELISLSIILTSDLIRERLGQAQIEKLLDRFQILVDKLNNHYRITDKSNQHP